MESSSSYKRWYRALGLVLIALSLLPLSISEAAGDDQFFITLQLAGIRPAESAITLAKQQTLVQREHRAEDLTADLLQLQSQGIIDSFEWLPEDNGFVVRERDQVNAHTFQRLRWVKEVSVDSDIVREAARDLLQRKISREVTRASRTVGTESALSTLNQGSLAATVEVNGSFIYGRAPVSAQVKVRLLQLDGTQVTTGRAVADASGAWNVWLDQPAQPGLRIRVSDETISRIAPVPPLQVLANSSQDICSGTGPADVWVNVDFTHRQQPSRLCELGTYPEKTGGSPSWP